MLLPVTTFFAVALSVTWAAVCVQRSCAPACLMLCQQCRAPGCLLGPSREPRQGSLLAGCAPLQPVRCTIIMLGRTSACG
jgi:hypothetical protein